MTDNLMSREILFKLRYPNGDWVIIHTDGHVDGIPPGTLIINRYPVILNALRARQIWDFATDDLLRAQIDGVTWAFGE